MSELVGYGRAHGFTLGIVSVLVFCFVLVCVYWLTGRDGLDCRASV